MARLAQQWYPSSKVAMFYIFCSYEYFNITFCQQLLTKNTKGGLPVKLHAAQPIFLPGNTLSGPWEINMTFFSLQKNWTQYRRHYNSLSLIKRFKQTVVISKNSIHDGESWLFCCPQQFISVTCNILTHVQVKPKHIIPSEAIIWSKWTSFPE